jgi:hypothetical protein
VATLFGGLTQDRRTRSGGAGAVSWSFANGSLVFEPDASSAQRGARVRTWLSETMARVGPSRRDITGVRYRFVSPPVLLGEPEARYAATAFVGDLSTLEIADDPSSTSEGVSSHTVC